MLAFFDGEMRPSNQAAIPLGDAGFILGATVIERMRTFAGAIFGLDAHFARLERSLNIVNVTPRWTIADLKQKTVDVVQTNFPKLTEGDDLSVSVLVTPGPIETCLTRDAKPLVVITAEPIDFAGLPAIYQTGQRLRVSDVQQTPRECWPPELKCRSRMHYFLADQKARAIEAGSRALMVTDTGHVTEATTANLLVYKQSQGLITPPLESVLPGVSLAETAEIAAELNIPFSYQQLTPADLAAADEIMLTSTTPCVLPAVSLDGQPIGTGKPGVVFERLISAWNERAGFDLRQQTQKFEHRTASSR